MVKWLDGWGTVCNDSPFERGWGMLGPEGKKEYLQWLNG